MNNTKSAEKITNKIEVSQLLETLPGYIYWKNKKGVYLDCNENIAHLAGVKTPADVIGKTDNELLWHEYANELQNNDNLVITKEQEITVEETFKLQNGESKTFISIKKPWRDHNKQIIGIFGFSIDITLRKQTEDILIEKTEKQIKNIFYNFENLIACMPGSIYWKDKNGIYQGCNDVLVKAVGLQSKEQIIGKTDVDLAKMLHWPPKVIESILKIDKEVLSSGVAQFNIEETPFHFSDGKTIQQLTNKVPLRNEDSEIIGVVGVSIDITDRKKAEQELLAAKERAEAANKSKSEFFAAINHELRTPLTGMLGMARLLASEPLAPEHSSQVVDIISAGEHLLSLVNDLLDMAKLEAGKLELNPAPIDLRKLIEEVATMLATQAKIKNLEMRVNYEEGTPHLIVADGKAIRQVLLNLVGNALKFTHEGYIEIKVELVQQNVTEVALKMSVSDTGIGIPTDQLETVFERFNQVDNSRTRKYGGTGLGLTINKAFIELMGGKIQVTSEIDKGSIFSFDLIFPLQTEKTITSTWEPYRSNVRILIADDSLIGEVIKKHIGSSLCEIVSGAEVINYLLAAQQREQPFHIVMIDQQLKTANPIELVKKINNQNHFEHPMLMYLMKPCPITEKNAAQAEGFFDCLIKPLHPTELLTSLTAAWEKWQDRLKPQNAIVSLQSESSFKVLLVEDDPIIQKVHGMMLKKIGCIVDIANNGIEALAMFKNGYDVIFMDIGLGEMSGLDVAIEIRRRENNNYHLPIIAMTGYGDEESKIGCLAAGMNDVAVKPTTPETLKQLLEQWVVKAA